MRDDILGLVYAAIDEVNEQSLDGVRLEKRPDARLLGGSGGVDSLTFVNLIIAVEEQIEKVFRASVVLVTEESMTLQESPFHTAGALAAYVDSLLVLNQVRERAAPAERADGRPGDDIRERQMA